MVNLMCALGLAIVPTFCSNSLDVAIEIFFKDVINTKSIDLKYFIF